MWFDELCDGCLEIIHDNYDNIAENHDLVVALRLENERLQAENASIIERLRTAVENDKTQDLIADRGVKRRRAHEPTNRETTDARANPVRQIQIKSDELASILPSRYKNPSAMDKYRCPNPACAVELTAAVTKDINDHFDTTKPCHPHKTTFMRQLPYQCPAPKCYKKECPTGFASLRGLFTHMRQVHAKYIEKRRAKVNASKA